MDAYLNWFYAFATKMFKGIWQAISNIFLGLVQVFDFPGYIDQLAQYKNEFGVAGWIFCILSFIIVYAVWAIVIFVIVLLIRKYIRHRKTLVGNEDLLEEIADLHRDVLRLTKERERIMALKVGTNGLTLDEVNKIFAEQDDIAAAARAAASETETPAAAAGTAGTGSTETAESSSGVTAPDANLQNDLSARRFFRLSGVDDKYEYYRAPEYDNSMNLKEICEDLRNFACSRMRLYYEIKTIRLMFAGLASTKLIILQGISGTGKTSLPYMMGKYFQNDATIASVQPSWRDRNELFGYFNEFTKKFNETEVLKRIYEASYNDDINIIVLDEMNIARVEYYFAEMLSILEMPDPSEWNIELVPSAWNSDPIKLDEGKLRIPQNVWYIGTANNDDSTFAVSDKVYDRALVINLDKKGIAFDAPVTSAKNISYSHVEELYNKAIEEHPVSQETLDNVAKLDLYVIDHFRVAFGNRIIKQLNIFVPVYVGCGGTEIDGLDYLLATKVFRKFESLNLGLIRDEIRGLITYMDKIFGKNVMQECYAYLERLQKML